MYLEAPGAVTSQGRRKSIDTVTVRLARSAGPFYIGTDQPDASLQPSGATVPWGVSPATSLGPVAPPYPGHGLS